MDLSLERLYTVLGCGMHVELNPNLEARLDAAAERASVPVAQLVECALTRYLDEMADDPAQWVAATRQQLPQVWRRESFAHWGPPRAN